MVSLPYIIKKKKEKKKNKSSPNVRKINVHSDNRNEIKLKQKRIREDLLVLLDPILLVVQLNYESQVWVSILRSQSSFISTPKIIEFCVTLQTTVNCK